MKKLATFQSPQWGSNSKGLVQSVEIEDDLFQSPQWGSNSKVFLQKMYACYDMEFQSPQWGSNSKDEDTQLKGNPQSFQSPQWGSNSKGVYRERNRCRSCFSPLNGEVILKHMHGTTERLMERVSVPSMGK